MTLALHDPLVAEYAEQAEHPPYTEHPEYARTAYSGSAHVLVVGLDDAVTAALATNLEHAGCSVTIASDGLEALFALEHSIPDVIVLDLEIPLLSGFRLLTLVRRDPATRAVPVILVTDLSFAEARDAVLLGVDDFLPRDDTAGRIVDSVQRIVRRSPAVPAPAALVAA